MSETTPTMTVTSPNGGEIWPEGSPRAVTWATTDFTGTVDIEYSTDSGATWQDWIINTSDDGSEDVTVPYLPGTTVRVQVSAADGGPRVALAPADQSDADFEIQPIVVVTSPNGGESWLIGSTEIVTWDAGAYAGNVDVDISIDGGSTWSALVADTTNDGAEDVTVPPGSTHQARVRVGAANGDPMLALAPFDESDANIQIGGPPVDIVAGLPGISSSTLAWGDYDNDGDLDLALAGISSGSSRISRIYRNIAGAFTDITAGLPGVSHGSLAWGDYDNDGDLDLALAGLDSGFNRISRIYENDGGTFTDLMAGLRDTWDGVLAWGDFDDDGDLDLALAGQDDFEVKTCRIYRNDGGFVPNTPGSAPTSLAAVPAAGEVTLSWSPAADTQTPEAGLSYNLRIGTTPTASENNPAMAAGGGYRRIPVLGPVVHKMGGTISHTVKLPAGSYYASVQAIDASLAGGPWSEPAMFAVP